MLNKRKMNNSRHQHDQLDNCRLFCEHVDSIFPTPFSPAAATDRTRSLSQSWNKIVITCLQWIILVTLVYSTVDHVITYTYIIPLSSGLCKSHEDNRLSLGSKKTWPVYVRKLLNLTADCSTFAWAVYYVFHHVEWRIYSFVCITCRPIHLHR